ncbi:MAG TPA: methyltransferase domain-containing protein, partial [Candidatus Angelobacter sp.]
MTTDTGLYQSRSLSSRDIGDHYNQFAWAYRRYWGDHIHHGLFLTGNEDREESQQLMLRHCAVRVGLCAGLSVADVGCGHGATAALLATEYSCKILGLTISETQFKYAREACASLNGNVHFELANAEEYVFPAGSFDVIWNMESSEHFFDKPAYFRKVATALKPGGKLMVAAWSGSMKDQIIREIARGFLCPELW